MNGSTLQGERGGSPALAVDAATLYPEDDGFFGKRAKAARARLLAGIDGALRSALAPGEVVRYAARACRYWFAEYLFSGQAARHHNMVALVATDRRLLLIQLTSRGKAGDMKNQIPLAEIRRAGSGKLSGWAVELADGTKEAFITIAKKDRKRLEPLLAPASAGAALPALHSGQPSLQHLCPACLQPVPGKVGATLVCPSPVCRIPFRDPARAARLSAVVPGLGDLYLRHHLFGSIEFLGSMLLLGLGAVFVVDAVADARPSKLIPAAILLGFFIVIPRVVDYFVTLHMGRKGLVPLALAPAPGAQARNLPSFPRWSPLLFVAGVAVAALIGVSAGDDLRHDGAVREAGELAAAGKFDEAQARYKALALAGGVSEERKVRFALALLEAGDLDGMDAIRMSFGDKPVEKRLADRWNAAIAEEQEALTGYEEGVKALVEGSEAGIARLDRALAYLAKVKRPHMPASRAEVYAHLTAQLLAPPVAPRDLANASRWIASAAGAPAAELAVVRAAHLAATGEAGAARPLLGGADVSALPAVFGLLALETRLALSVGDDAQLANVRKAAAAFPRDGLDDEDVARLEAITEGTK